MARFLPGSGASGGTGGGRCPQLARPGSAAPYRIRLHGDRPPVSGRYVVMGGSGFLGSHLCDRLLGRGDEVVCVDDFSTGRRSNVTHLSDHPAFSLVEADISVSGPVEGSLTGVLHLASAASPPDYLARPLQTLAAGSEGTRLGLELAERHEARFLLASTSEVYGDPDVHPQTETYWGNVNPVGPRSVYDEAKRFAEALTMAHHRERGPTSASPGSSIPMGRGFAPTTAGSFPTFCFRPDRKSTRLNSSHANISYAV